jgi:predicted dithiol-disulfide oxidoreductase (DUF899 family)
VAAGNWISAAVRAASTDRRLRAGETLFRFGEETVGLYDVVEGKVRLVRLDRSSRETVLQMASIGGILGEASLFSSAYDCDEESFGKGHLGMNTPPIVSRKEWEAARQQMLVKEKALMRARDALAAERRRMLWMAVERVYEFEGPQGKVSLLNLFEGRRQLIVYRAFFEPGVFGWPEHACRGCSLGADQVAHLAHLNARDTTLAYASRAPQADIARLKARMGWEMPWYTITDTFDADFGVNEWHGHNVFFRDDERVFRTYLINSRGDEATWRYLDITPLGRQETWEDSPPGYPQTPPYKWWNWHDNYTTEATPHPKWVEVSDAGEAAFRKCDAAAKA